MFGALRGRFMLVLTLAFISISAIPGTALANPTCDSITPTLGDTVTCGYLAGGATTISVPLGTIAIDVSVRGGGGAVGGTYANPGYRGGSGAQIQARLSRPTSTFLTIVVGNGGQGPLLIYRGGDGGGFSAIYDGVSTSHENVIAVAGGGGGGGYGTRDCYPSFGGDGGLDANGAGRPGLGDAPGGGGGGYLGPGGSVYAVPVGLGTSGSRGSDWSVGGAGGFGGGDEGADGGAGYGGGGGGGVITNPSPSSDCPATPADGSGGGAGGSYVKPAQQMGFPRYDNSGGAGGDATSWGNTAGVAGSVTLTFVQTYTVTYDGNGATGGTVPTDHTGSYLGGWNVTVCDDHRTDLNCDFPNAERMTRDGYTFDGWNTARNGSGTSYASGNEFVIGADTVLYAQWKVRPSADNTVQNTPAATPTLRTTKPKTTATGVTVTFTAPGPGTATASGTASQATRASVTVCRGTTKILKAGKAVVTCTLNATGRRLRAKGTLTVVLTTTFVAKTSTRLQATHTVVLPRRG